MTSTELKDALSRRLKKIDATGGETSHENRTDVSPPHGSEHPSSQSPDAKDMNQLYRSGWNATAPIPRSTALPAPPPMFPSPMKSDSVPRKPSPEEITSGVVDQRVKDLADRRSSMSSSARNVTTADSVLEGYLYKFSSGTLTSRWQKRYFVLRESGLEYFGKQAHAKASVPGTSVSFPLRRIRAVSPGASAKEFELTIGKTRRKYSLKASSVEACRLWVSELQKAVASQANGAVSGESNASDADANESDMIGGSSLNDNSSSRSVGILPSEGGEVAVTDTVWEQPEISAEEIDALFAEWFVFIEDLRSDIKAGRMIDAASRAVSDLWAVIAHLPRGEDVSFTDAKPKLVETMDAANGLQRASAITGEYVMRLCQKFLNWLNRRQTSEDIPVLIEWTSRLRRNLATLALGVASLNDSVSSNPEGVSPTHSDGGAITASSDKWPRALKQLVRKLAAEWEVGLIEQLHVAMPGEGVWDLPPVETTNAKTPAPHGPLRTSPTFLGASSLPVTITSWTETYLSRLSLVCLARSTAKGTPWSAAYPTCTLLLTTHAASAVVASLNACWREFKRRAAAYAKFRSSAVGSMIKKVKHFTGRLSVSSPPPTPQGGSKLSTTFENMLAFANEATLVSVFCQHASALAEFRTASPAFAACLEGLSATFANTSNETAKAIVKLHFLKRHHKAILSAFDPKHLAVRVKVPIAEPLELAKEFIDSLPGNGCHELLRYLIVGQVMQGLANAYITSMTFHRPKTSKFTRLAAVVAEDEGLFFSMFKDLGRPATEINTAIDQISHVHTVLSEQNLAPPSKGGVPLVQECVELTKAFPSSQKALEVVKALLDMKGISKSDRKDIIYSVSACMQRHAESPSPALLDLSREEEDEDNRPDASGFSSNRSSSKTADDSP